MTALPFVPAAALSAWDVALVVAVTTMVVVMAVLREPRRKALVLSVPVPFTIATLAIGRPVDATHVAALGLLFVYTLAVYLLHRRLRLGVLSSIGIAVSLYLAGASAMNAVVPRHDGAFWTAVAVMSLVAAVLLWRLPHSREQGVRHAVPLARKLPVTVVVSGLVAMKGLLGGFMTLFPMVGVVASYENRAGLWANVRQVPVVMVTMLPLMVTARLAEPRFGLPWALLMGWIPFLLVVAPFLQRSWRQSALTGTRSAAADRGGHHVDERSRQSSGARDRSQPRDRRGHGSRVRGRRRAPLPHRS